MFKKISRNVRNFVKKLSTLQISVPALFGGSKITMAEEPKHIRVNDYKFLDKVAYFFNRKPSKKHPEDLLYLTKGPRRMGLLILLIFFGIFGAWAAFAPLDGAVLATGEIVIRSDKKVVQHLEGGIIKQILVQEGATVEQGQPLIYINNINVTGQLKILKERFIYLRLTEARLMAEGDYRPEILLPDDIAANKEDPNIQKIIYNQNQLFKARMNAFNNQIDIMRKRIDQINNEISALDFQLKSAQRQLELLEKDLEDKRELLKRNIINKNQVMGLEREQASLLGKIGESRSHIARAEQKVSETELEILNIRNKFNNEIVNEIKETATLIHETKEKLAASEDIVERTIIRAPQAGKITGLKFYTIGGVIPPGATIMEITPEEQELVIEARILPTNIEAVISARLNPKNERNLDHIEGLAAKVRLTAFSPRKLGLLNAVMTYVSADVLTDNRNGMRYYLAYIKIPPSEMKKIKTNIKLYPGMPAVVYISTESRTLLSYLLAPITSTFDNAFKEG